MKCHAVLGLALLAASTGLSVKTNPVEKITNLLKGLKTGIVSDGEKEELAYNRFACWCHNMLAGKTDAEGKDSAIENAHQRLYDVGNLILELKGKIATSVSISERCDKDMQANQNMQNRNTNARQNEHKKYDEANQALQQSGSQLFGALNVLGKPHSLLQTAAAAGPMVQAAIEALPMDNRVLKPEHLALLTRFVSESHDSAHYAPQSETVLGILKDMFEEVTADLERGDVDEAMAMRHYEQNMLNLRDSMNTLNAEKKQAQNEKADAEEELAQAISEYDSVQAQMEQDIKFFDETTAACRAKADEWKARSAARVEELAGVDKALEILTSDEARAMFTKAIKPGRETTVFFQSNKEISLSMLAKQQNAYKVLKSAAREFNKQEIALLAVRVHETTTKSGFKEVRGALARLIANLDKEYQEDIDYKDRCKVEIHDIEIKQADLRHKISVNDAKIEKLENRIEKQEKEKAETIADIAANIKAMNDMAEQREMENTTFAQDLADDKVALELLTRARDALTEFYTNNDVKMGPIDGDVKASLVQVQSHKEPVFQNADTQAPDAGLSGAGSRSTESKGIVSLMSMLIEDLKEEIKAGIKTEYEANKAYLAANNTNEEERYTLNRAKTALEDGIAANTQSKNDEFDDKDVNNGDLTTEINHREDIRDCDWLLSQFDHRKKMRNLEKKSLVEADQFLAGMAGGAASATSAALSFVQVQSTGFMARK